MVSYHAGRDLSTVTEFCEVCEHIEIMRVELDSMHCLLQCGRGTLIFKAASLNSTTVNLHHVNIGSQHEGIY